MSDGTQQTATYDPSIFLSPRSFERALAIAITPEEGTTTESRFETETPYFVDLLEEYIKLKPGDRVMDYGCGPGRLAKELLTRKDVRIYGVDLSPAMLSFAHAHAHSPNFLGCPPEMVDDLPPVDAIIMVWVLQHIPKPERILTVMMNKLKPRGRMFIVNAWDQIFPIPNGQWLHSRETNVLELVRERMKQVAFGDGFDPAKTSDAMAHHGWWGVFESNLAF